MIRRTINDIEPLMDRMNHISKELMSQYEPNNRPYSITPYINDTHTLLRLKRSTTSNCVMLTINEALLDLAKNVADFKLINGKVDHHGNIYMAIKFLNRGTIKELKQYGHVETKLYVGHLYENLTYDFDKRVDEIKFGLGIYFGALMAKRLSFTEDLMLTMTNPT